MVYVSIRSVDSTEAPSEATSSCRMDEAALKAVSESLKSRFFRGLVSGTAPV